LSPVKDHLVEGEMTLNPPPKDFCPKQGRISAWETDRGRQASGQQGIRAGISQVLR